MVWEQLRLDGGADRVTAPSAKPTANPYAAAAELVDAGLTYSEAARSLNARGVPTASGRGRWHPQSVRHGLHREQWAAYMRGYRGRQH